MRAAIVITSAGMLAGAAWMLSRQQGTGDGVASDQAPGLLGSAENIMSDTAQGVEQFVEKVVSVFNLGNMRKVTAADLQNKNVRALLAVIRRGEGTSGPNGYKTLFGGGLFTGWQHPNKVISKGGYRSTAAGAYQALYSTWVETAAIMGLPDMTPANQDRFAVGRIAARGALDDARAGRIGAALAKIGREWASMPGSPYGQPTISEQTARSVYASAGGTITA